MKWLFSDEDVKEAVSFIEKGRKGKYRDWYDDTEVIDGKLYYQGKEVVPESKVDSIIQEFYTNPRLTGNRDKLFDRIKERYIGVSRRRIMSWLKNQESWQLRTRAIRTRVTKPILVSRSNAHWQMDLIDVSTYWRSNKGYKWILTIIDIFSKRLIAHPLKTKTGENIVEALKNIDSLPRVIQTDRGGEFVNTVLDDFLRSKGVKHILSQAYRPTTQGVVERVNGTLKQMIFDHFVRSGTKTWIDVLPDFVQNYNSTIHSTIGMRPNEYNEGNREKVSKKIKGKTVLEGREKIPELRVGDTVRISLRALTKNQRTESGSRGVRGNVFPSNIENWTRDIYRITKIIRGNEFSLPRYKVEGMDKTFNGYELQKIDEARLNRDVPRIQTRTDDTRPFLSPRIPTVRRSERIASRERKASLRSREKEQDEEGEYEVERLLDKRRSGRRIEYLVKWKGYPLSQATWEPISHLKNAREAIREFEKKME